MTQQGAALFAHQTANGAHAQQACGVVGCPMCHPQPQMSWPERPQYGCTCGKPMLLYIPAGSHAHPCPVHPEFAVYGQEVTC